MKPSQASSELRRMRELGCTNPQKILELARPLFQDGQLDISSGETYSILEQTAIASLIVGEDELASKCITLVSDKFPHSARTLVLRGMLLEVQDTSKAMEFYNSVLKVQESNLPIHKRKISLLRSTGRMEDAVNALAKLADFFPMDAEIWAELVDVYLAMGMYEQAAFAAEEMILLQPLSHFVHARYADIQFKMGDECGALKSYLRSAELCSEQLHSAVGVKTCIDRLRSSKSQKKAALQGIKAGELEKLDLKWVQKLVEIQRNYQTVDETALSQDTKQALAMAKILVGTRNEPYS